jgi:hypothetical protein
MKVWRVCGFLCQQMINPSDYSLLFLDPPARHLPSIQRSSDGVCHEVMVGIGHFSITQSQLESSAHLTGRLAKRFRGMKGPRCFRDPRYQLDIRLVYYLDSLLEFFAFLPLCVLLFFIFASVAVPVLVVPG